MLEHAQFAWGPLNANPLWRRDVYLLEEIKVSDARIAELEADLGSLRSDGYFHIAGPRGEMRDEIQPMIEEAESEIRDCQRLIEIARSAMAKE